jgi:hypothetical protein
MTGNVRCVASTTIALVVVLAAAGACSGTQNESDPTGVLLPSRSPRDAAPNAADVLVPADTGPLDTGPPPDPFCLETGLVLCFTFDNAVENLVPGTQKLVPAKVVEVTLVSGKKSQAAQFDTGSVITFDYAPILEMQAATVESWVNHGLTAVGDDTIFDNDARFAMTIEQDGTLRCNTKGATVRGGNVPIEIWTHLACVFDGTAIKGYVNGVEVSSGAGAIGVSNTAGAAIGDNSEAGGEAFTGELDSLRVFSTARTAAEIAASAAP